MASIDELSTLISRHAPGDGVYGTIVSGLVLYRSSTTMQPVHTVYEPALCLVAQGRKQAMLGDTAYVYDPAHYLVVAVDLPVIGSVLEASDAQPYLCLRLDLNLPLLGEVVLSHGGGKLQPPSGLAPGLTLSQANAGLIDAATRLMRLLDEPADVVALTPLIEREIYYRLLMGDQGQMIRHIVNAESRLAQISRSITWLKKNFASDFGIGDLAGISAMSESSFYEHFKKVTSMSPIQYRNLLRLQEARRLMVEEACDAAAAGFAVGYESPSQFSRDYVRLFGSPPARDAARLRAGQGLLMAL